VPVDLERLRTAPQISPQIKINGCTYDVTTGLVTPVG
jgi:hypothetical protein